MKKIIFLILLIVLTVHFESIRGDDRDHDTVTINNILVGKTAYVLVDGLSASGCKNDEKFMVTTNSPFSIGDFIANDAGCTQNEIFVFSKGKMAVRKTKNWVGNQNLNISLSTFKTVKVKFWIPPNEAGISWRAIVDAYIVRANLLFHDFSFGLQISASFNTSRQMAAYKSVITPSYTSCCNALFTRLKDDFYTKKIINVYLVDSIPDEGGGARGYNCSSQRNVIFLDKNTATVETLAHEIGHAFSLFHSETMHDFTLRNIMNGSETIRDTFHLGQAFQTNFNELSFFKNYFSSTTTTGIARRDCFRSCIDAGSTIRCPMQSLNY